jgi:hypothetical protein
MERPPAERFEDLVVWQKSHQLVLKVYLLTRACLREEQRILSSAA